MFRTILLAMTIQTSAGQPIENPHVYEMIELQGYITNHPGSVDEVAEISQTQPTEEDAKDLCQKNGKCVGFSYQPSAGTGSSFRFFFKSHGEIYNDCWKTWRKGSESEFTELDGFVAATEEHESPPDGLGDQFMTIQHAKEACANNALCGGFSKRHGSGIAHFKVAFSKDKVVHECWKTFLKDHKEHEEKAEEAEEAASSYYGGAAEAPVEEAAPSYYGGAAAPVEEAAPAYYR